MCFRTCAISIDGAVTSPSMGYKLLCQILTAFWAFWRFESACIGTGTGMFCFHSLPLPTCLNLTNQVDFLTIRLGHVGSVAATTH